MRHPRFLGFLWKYHVFFRITEKPCTLKCEYCDKIKHLPNPSDIMDLDKNTPDLPLIYHFTLGSYEYRKCKICNKLERRFFHQDVETGFYCGKWEDCSNRSEIAKK